MRRKDEIPLNNLPKKYKIAEAAPNPFFRYKNSKEYKEEFKTAKKLLAQLRKDNPKAEGLKVSRKDTKLKHSFVELNGKIYALAHRSKQSGVKYKLGKGAFGKAKIAMDERGVLYAIKTIRGEAFKSNSQETEFAKKIGILENGMLRIKRSKESSKDSDHYYGALYYLGETLSNRLAPPKADDSAESDSAEESDSEESDSEYSKESAPPKKPLSDIERLKLAINLCTITQELHSAGIAHNDPKPANILITPDLKLIYIDYGLSTHLTADITKLQGSLPYRLYSHEELLLSYKDPKYNDFIDKKLAQEQSLGHEKIDWIGVLRILFSRLLLSNGDPCILNQTLYDSLPSAAKIYIETTDVNKTYKRMIEKKPPTFLTAFFILFLSFRTKMSKGVFNNLQDDKEFTDRIIAIYKNQELTFLEKKLQYIQVANEKLKEPIVSDKSLINSIKDNIKIEKELRHYQEFYKEQIRKKNPDFFDYYLYNLQESDIEKKYLAIQKEIDSLESSNTINDISLKTIRAYPETKPIYEAIKKEEKYILEKARTNLKNFLVNFSSSSLESLPSEIERVKQALKNLVNQLGDLANEPSIQQEIKQKDKDIKTQGEKASILAQIQAFPIDFSKHPTDYSDKTLKSLYNHTQKLHEGVQRIIRGLDRTLTNDQDITNALKNKKNEIDNQKKAFELAIENSRLDEIKSAPKIDKNPTHIDFSKSKNNDSKNDDTAEIPLQKIDSTENQKKEEYKTQLITRINAFNTDFPEQETWESAKQYATTLKNELEELLNEVKSDSTIKYENIRKIEETIKSKQDEIDTKKQYIFSAFYAISDGLNTIKNTQSIGFFNQSKDINLESLLLACESDYEDKYRHEILERPEFKKGKEQWEETITRNFNEWLTGLKRLFTRLNQHAEILERQQTLYKFNSTPLQNKVINLLKDIQHFHLSFKDKKGVGKEDIKKIVQLKNNYSNLSKKMDDSPLSRSLSDYFKEAALFIAWLLTASYFTKLISRNTTFLQNKHLKTKIEKLDQQFEELELSLQDSILPPQEFRS